jgi:CMP-N,N'-diacetyllegionaminic acid synthase
MTTVALIPARGGSKGIPRKNIQPFCGKPLIQWSIDLALHSPLIDRVVVSTDDLEISEIALSGGAEVPFIRPTELASDSASGISTVMHALEHLPAVSDLLLLQPTSPLRNSVDIDSIFALRSEFGSESAVSVSQSPKHPAWMYSIDQMNLLHPVLAVSSLTCRQQLSPVFALNGALYLASRSFLVREKTFVSNDTVGYVMPRERSLDIDTPLDWLWGEFLMQRHIFGSGNDV